MAVQVANLLAQIGADITQFKQGMAEVDARLNATGSRAVTAMDHINNMRSAAGRAGADSAKLSMQSKQAFDQADATIKKIAAARQANANLATGLKAEATQIASTINQITAAQAKAAAETTKKADEVLTKLADVRKQQAAASKVVERQAIVSRSGVLDLKRRSRTSAEAARENIDSLGAKYVVATSEARKLEDRATKAQNAGNDKLFRELSAKQLIKINQANEFERAQERARLAEQERANKVKAEIYIAEKKTNLLRDQALALSRGDTEQVKRLVEQEKKLRDEASKQLTAKNAQLRNMSTRAANLQAKAAALSAGDTVEVQRLIDEERKLRGRGRRLSNRSQERFEEGTRRDQAADNYERDIKANAEVAKNYADRLAENAREHQVRAINNIAQSAMTAGTVISGAFVAASMAGSKYNEMLLKAQNNTSLVGDETKVMASTIAKLGVDSGASLDELAAGYQKVENFSFNAADSAKIVEQAMRSSVSTGSDLSSTSELLAKVLVQFGLGADKAADAMNTMHVAANLSSLEMQQLVDVGGATYSIAASLGVGFTEANAALVTFTKQGLNAHEAMTQFRNDLSKIVSPTGAVSVKLEDLKKKTGVDLPKAFTYSTLKAKGLAFAFSEVRKAATKGGMDPKQLANQLFPNLRGTIGAMILSGDAGFKQFEKTTGTLNEAFAGRLDPTTEQYAKTLELTETQINRAKNAMTLLAAEINKATAPAIIGLSSYIMIQIKAFMSMSDEAKNSYVTFGLIAGGVLIATGAILKLIVGLASLKEAMMAITGTETLAASMGVLSGSLGTARIAVLGFISAWGIWIALAAVVVGALVVLYNYIQFANNSEKIYAKSVQESADASKKAADAAYLQAASTSNLIKSITDLSNKTNKTTEEKTKLRDMMNSLSTISPELVTGYDNQGNAIINIGKAATFATAELAKMAKQSAIAQQRATLTSIQPDIQRRSEVQDRLRRLKQMQNDGEAFVTRPSSMYELSGNRDFDVTKAVPLYSIKDKDEYNKAIGDRAAELRQLYAEEARLHKVVSAGMNKAKREIKGLGLPSIPTAVGPKPTTVEQATTDYKYVKPTKEKKAKSVKDPLDEWRRYIMQTQESMFKLNNLDPLADAQWMKISGSVEKKLDAIKSLKTLYDLASNSAERLAIMQKRATENKSYEKAMEAVRDMGHKPKSESLGDIARNEVGDPSKDRWHASFLTNKLAPAGSPAKVLFRPDYLTGNDPEKKRWMPDQKARYIKAMEAEQDRRDTEKANKQREDIMERINKPLEKQKSIYAQVIDEIETMPELYKELGDRGATELGRIAQGNYDLAQATKLAQQAADKFIDSYNDQWTKASDKYTEVLAQIKGMSLQQDGFGQQMSDEAYSAAAAFDLYGKSLSEIDPFLRIFVDYIGQANKELSQKQHLKEYTDGMRELSAEYTSIMMKGSDFDKWLMKNTGFTSSTFKGTYKDLTLDQYKDRFKLERDTNDANSLKSANDDLKNTRVEMGLVKFKTKDAQVAWELFHRSFKDLAPDVQNEVKKLAAELGKLDKIRKIQRIWQTAADTLQSSFENAFTAVLNKQQSFWEAFSTTIKQAVISIIASESAKEIVRFIGKITGMSKKGTISEDENNGTKTANSLMQGEKSNPQSTDGISIATVLGTVLGTAKNKTGENSPLGGMSDILSEILLGSKKKEGEATPVFIVGAAPGLFGQAGMAGIPGMPNAGGGGMGGMLGGMAGGLISKQIGGALGSFGGPIGTMIGAGIGSLVGKLFKFEKGGRPTPNVPAIIGEGGPEIWVPDSPGTVKPNSSLEDMMDGRSVQGISVYNTGDNHYYSDTDAELVAQKTANKLDRKLRLNP